MTMLFNIEQYHQPVEQRYQCDWDGAVDDPAWKEFDDIPKPQTLVGAIVEHSIGDDGAWDKFDNPSQAQNKVSTVVEHSIGDDGARNEPNDIPDLQNKVSTIVEDSTGDDGARNEPNDIPDLQNKVSTGEEVSTGDDGARDEPNDIPDLQNKVSTVVEDSTGDDGARNEPNDIPDLQNKVSTVVEVSTGEEVEIALEALEAPEAPEAFFTFDSNSWNPAHFGEMPRKLDSEGNPTIFWDDSIEPPEPDDFESLQEYEEAWQKWEQENSDNLTCVAALGQVSPSLESSPKKSNYADCAKSIPFVKKDCSNDSLASQFTTTLENFQKSQELTASHHRPPVNPLPLKGIEGVELISEIASPQYYELLPESNPNFSVSKTSPDCYQHLSGQETNPEHISNRCSGSFASVGIMRNGRLLELDLNLEPDGPERDSYSLPRPGALSWSGNGRPPGTTKSEAKAKELGLIGKNEVFNPEWLEQEFGLPIGWTDPQECRAATQLLELAEHPSEIVSTPGLVKSFGDEYSTSTPFASVQEQSTEYSTTKSNIVKAISLWQPWASLIPLGLKHYETRGWKTKYRGKLLICSTAKSTKAQYQQYLKICNEVDLPAWDKDNFPRGCAIAICDLVDCIEMTPEFIAQQSETEILCGDWQVGRYAWKLENIQPLTEPFSVKGKQKLFNVPFDSEYYLKTKDFDNSNPLPKKSKSKSSDCWYSAARSNAGAFRNGRGMS